MNTLTAKELTALEEQLGSEVVLISKFQTYAEMATDPKVKSVCNAAATRHKKHYTILQKYLTM